MASKTAAAVLGVLAAATASATVEACAGPPPPPAHAPVTLQSTAAETPATRGVVPDERIVAILKRELASDSLPSPVSHTAIGVDSVRGVVTLTASVPSRLTKQRAVEIARIVRGVRAVVDRIEVEPQPKPDYEVDFLVAGALAHDPVTANQGIAASARQARVTLSGTVDSNATRRIAQDDVLALPGVRDVVDMVTIMPGVPTDTQLSHEVDRVVRQDLWLDDARIHVML